VNRKKVERSLIYLAVTIAREATQTTAGNQLRKISNLSVTLMDKS
jgi:hypothetical protein